MGGSQKRIEQLRRYMHSRNLLIAQIPFCNLVPKISFLVRCYGIDLSSQTTSRCGRICITANKILVIVLQLCLCAACIVAFMGAISMSAVLAFSAVAITTSVLSSVTCYAMLLVQKPRLSAFFKKLLVLTSKVFPGTIEGYQRTYRVWDLTVTVIFVSCLVPYLTQRAIFHYVMEVPPDGDDYDQFHDPHLEDKYFIFQLITKIFMELVIMYVKLFEFVSMALFAFTCCCFKFLLREVSLRVQREVLSQRDESPCTLDSMKDIYSTHRDICSLIAEADSLYAPLVLVWCAAQVLKICFWIRSFNSDLLGDIATHYYVAVVVLNVFSAAVPFLLVCLNAAVVNHKLVSSMRVCKYIQCEAFDDKLKLHHLFYVTELQVSPSGLTAWRFFIISRAFILTVAGTVVTYTLVLYGLT